MRAPTGPHLKGDLVWFVVWTATFAAAIPVASAFVDWYLDGVPDCVNCEPSE